MKKIITFLLQAFLLNSIVAQQNIGIGTPSPHASAALDISSTTKGLLVPRMSSAQRTSIASPAKGLIIFDNQTATYWYHNGNAWKEIDGKNYTADDSLVVGQQLGGPAGYNLTGNINLSDSSGFLYDSGGPTLNYSNNEDYTLTIPYSPNQLATDINVFSMAVQSPDSLFITDEFGHSYAITGTTTGVFRVYDQVKIRFKSNSNTIAAGFMLRWNKIYLSGGNAPYNSNQLTGWRFDPVKLYMRGGNNGNNNWHPDSSGALSFGFGSGVQAKGSYSVATGYNSRAQGNNAAVALGWQTLASGHYGSVAIGDQAKATGNSGATAFGSSTLASGEWGATAMGHSTEASGESAMAAGYFSRASGTSSIALGHVAMATGSTSVAIGPSTMASGPGSAAFGFATNATGSSTTAMGANTIASGNFAMSTGYHTVASGSASFASGHWTKAKSHAGFVTGIYNDTSYNPVVNETHPLNRIFEIGNGTSDYQRTNAMTVLQNGNVGIGTTTPSEKLHLIGNLRLEGDLTTLGYGIVRNNAAQQLKIVTTVVSVNYSGSPIPAEGTASKVIAWAESFSSPPAAYIANVVSGTGGWAEVVLTIGGTTNTHATLYIHNPRNVAASPSFLINVIAIGQ
jgi:hypothetical protein